MKIIDLQKYIKRADDLWSTQCDLYGKYCGGGWLDGTPSWCLGVEGIDLSWSEVGCIRTRIGMNKKRKMSTRLLEIVEEEAGDVTSHITDDAFHRYRNSEYFKREYFPNMNNEEITLKFYEDRENLCKEYQILIDEIKKSMDE